MASLLFANDASLDEFRAKVGCHLAENRTISEERQDCSNLGHLVGALTVIAATSTKTVDVGTTKLHNVEQHSIYLIKDVKSGVAADQAGCQRSF